MVLKLRPVGVTVGGVQVAPFDDMLVSLFCSDWIPCRWLCTLILSSVPRLLANLLSWPPTKSSTLLRRAMSAFIWAAVMLLPANRLVNSLYGSVWGVFLTPFEAQLVDLPYGRQPTFSSALFTPAFCA